MTDLQLEYQAMRRDKAKGYGCHSFEHGHPISELRKRCISVLEQRCKVGSGAFENQDLRIQLDNILNKGNVINRVSEAVKLIKQADYYKLVHLEAVLRQHVCVLIEVY